MPHQLAPTLASTAKTAPFQPVASCPSFSKYPRKSHSAFKPETQRPCFLCPGEAPPRGCLLHGATLERLCDCVLACRVVSRGHVPLMRSCPCPSWPSWPWRGCGRAVAWPSCPGCRGVPGCGRGAAWPWLWCPLSLCRRRVVATRRRMLVFAMVLVVSVLTWFALRLQGVYSESHQANDNERNRDEREATTTETTTARPVTRSPLTGAAWMIEN